MTMHCDRRQWAQIHVQAVGLAIPEHADPQVAALEQQTPPPPAHGRHSPGTGLENFLADASQRQPPVSLHGRSVAQGSIGGPEERHRRAARQDDPLGAR